MKVPREPEQLGKSAQEKSTETDGCRSILYLKGKLEFLEARRYEKGYSD